MIPRSPSHGKEARCAGDFADLSKSQLSHASRPRIMACTQAVSACNIGAASERSLGIQVRSASVSRETLFEPARHSLLPGATGRN
jgi:hypothetical protein